MKRTIKFGNQTAILHNGERCAKLMMSATKLPLALADVINSTPEIEVSDVSCNSEGSVIRMWHTLSPGDLIATVCAAIGAVYSEDTAVSHE